jgi:drug/metabolite transporter (DMT)-like permease
VAALLWAIDAPFRKYLTQGLSSTVIVLMEHIVIAFLVLPLFIPRIKELRNLSFKEWLAIFFVGFGGSALATVLFTQSFHYVNPSVSILLQKIQPIIAILLAGIILKERFGHIFWLWSGVAIFSAYAISFPEIKISGLNFSGGTLGIILALLAAFFWGASTVFGRLVLKKISFQMMTFLRFWSALIFLVLINFYYSTTHEIQHATNKDWLFVFIIAVLAGFVSLLIYYKGLQLTKAGVATIAELAFPFAAVIINWVFLGEALTVVQIVGSLVLLFSVSRLSADI